MLPPEELIEWLLALVPWMSRSLAIPARRGTIVLPRDEEFPVDTTLEGRELAQDFLGFVVEHAGMGDRRFVVRMEQERGAAAAMRGLKHAKTPPISGGTEEPVERGKPLPIPITAATLKDPPRLIAVLGRGVAHHRVREARTPAPGPESMRGAVVDVTTVFLGFGVFFANACHDAHVFESDGMMMMESSVQRLGELGPVEAAYALALRTRLIGAEPSEIALHLRENPRAFFQDALRDVDERDLVALDVPSAGAYRS